MLTVKTYSPRGDLAERGTGKMLEITNGCATHTPSNETVVLARIVSLQTFGACVTIQAIGGTQCVWSFLDEAEAAGAERQAVAHEQAKEAAREAGERLSLAVRRQQMHARGFIIFGENMAVHRWSDLLSVYREGSRVSLRWSGGVTSSMTDDGDLYQEIKDKWTAWLKGACA